VGREVARKFKRHAPVSGNQESITYWLKQGSWWRQVFRGKIFETELFPWYGSATLPEYLKVYAGIEKSHP